MTAHQSNTDSLDTRIGIETVLVKKMKAYYITIPAFTRTMIADNRKEALELFFFDYDNAQQDSDSRKPIIKDITKQA